MTNMVKRMASEIDMSYIAPAKYYRYGMDMSTIGVTDIQGKIGHHCVGIVLCGQQSL